MSPEPLLDDPAATAQDRLLVGRTLAIARSAVARGNHPFGALLALGRDVLAEQENEVVTTKDATRHAETALVAAVTATLAPEVLRTATLYTSTEPCVMCCGAIHWSGIGGVVYGVTASQMSAVASGDYRPIPCREIFERLGSPVSVRGPVSEAEGLAIHRDFWPAFLGRR